MATALQESSTDRPEQLVIHAPSAEVRANALRTFSLPSAWSPTWSASFIIEDVGSLKGSVREHVKRLEDAGVVPFTSVTYKFRRGTGVFEPVLKVRENMGLYVDDAELPGLEERVSRGITEGKIPNHIRIVDEGETGLEFMQQVFLDHLIDQGYTLTQATIFLLGNQLSSHLAINTSRIGLHGRSTSPRYTGALLTDASPVIAGSAEAAAITWFTAFQRAHASAK